MWSRARELASLRTADEIRGYETAKGTPGHYFDADTVATSYAIAFGRAAATINQLASLIAPHRSGAAIRQIERGGKRTSIRYLNDIARALSVDTSDLIAPVPDDSEAA